MTEYEKKLSHEVSINWTVYVYEVGANSWILKKIKLKPIKDSVFIDIWFFIVSFPKDLLSTDYVPSTQPDSQNTQINRIWHYS